VPDFAFELISKAVILFIFNGGSVLKINFSVKLQWSSMVYFNSCIN